MFKKNYKYLLVFIIYYFLSLSSNAQIVKEIVISGNDRVNTDTIKVFSDIDIGDDISQKDLNNILKKLYETNFFKDIKLNLNKGVLSLNVIENPVIQNIIFNGIRSKEFKKAIRERISLKEKNPLVENQIQIELEKIKIIMQETGYYFSEISLSQKVYDNNTIDLIFDVDLGDKAFIKEIVFIGDKKFKKRQLLSVIASEEDKFWKFISNKRLLNNQRISLDKRLLKNFYRNKGYYNVEISDQTIQYQDDKNFKLIFNINSGLKYNFGKFEINFPDDYDQKYFDKTIEKLNKFEDTRYSYRVVEKILDEIEKIASNNNFEFINAEIDEKIVSNNINILINITENPIKTYVKKINIKGNDVTIEDVIRNELIIDEGDPLNNVLFNRSISNVKALNIFETVQTDIIDTDDELEKIIDIKVKEKATGEIMLGAGVGTSGTSTSFGVKENNFLGKGINLDSNLTLSDESIKGLFSYTKSHFNNTDRDLILTIQSSETDRLKDYGYKNSKTGFLIGTRFEHLEDLYITPSFSANFESIETSSTASALLKKQEDSYFDIDGNYRIDYDKRNQPYQPSAGFLSSFSQKIPMNIGENQTIVNSYEITSYREYLDDVVGSVSLFISNASSLGDDDVRISERLYLPARKLRGFESGKVGPIDNGDYVGGNYLTSLNIASNLPILPTLETVDFNIFYDAANVWGVDYSSSINESSKIRSATGIAMDWYTPIGPMSFSFSQPITKKNTDKTESFRFNLGTTF